MAQVRRYDEIKIKRTGYWWGGTIKRFAIRYTHSYTDTINNNNEVIYINSHISKPKYSLTLFFYWGKSGFVIKPI